MPYGSVTAQGLFKLADINMENRRLDQQGKQQGIENQFKFGQETRLQNQENRLAKQAGLEQQTAQMQIDQAKKNLELLNNQKELDGIIGKAAAAAPPGQAFNAAWDALQPLANDPKYSPLYLSQRDKLIQSQAEVLKNIDLRDPTKKTSTKIYNETIGAKLGDKIDYIKEIPEGTISKGWKQNPDGTWVEKQTLIPKDGSAPVDLTPALGLAEDPTAKKNKDWRTLPPVMEGGKPVIYETNQAGERRKVGIAQEHAGLGGASNGYPAVARLFATGGLNPQTRLTQPQMKAIQEGADYADAHGLPFGAEQVKGFVFDTARNEATGKTAGGRVTLTRAENIRAALPLVDDIERTAAKVNFSSNKYKAGFQEWKDTGAVSNDPVLTELLNQRADAMFALSNALKANGVTDMSLKIEQEVFRPTLDTKSVKSWANTQRRALNRAAMGMNSDYKMDIPLSPVADAGAGGEGPKYTPTDISQRPPAKKGPIKVGKYTVEAE